MVSFPGAELARAQVDSEMKHFPPQAKVEEWQLSGALQPSPVDQPLAAVRGKASVRLSERERLTALYLLTDGTEPLAAFQARPPVLAALAAQRAMEAKKEL